MAPPGALDGIITYVKTEAMMKRPTMLLCQVVRELASWYCLSIERDVEVIRHRVEHEGMSFLTLTLPSFCDAFERGLEDGCVSRASWGGFFRLPRRGCLPNFLSGFTTLVFNDDGSLRSFVDPDVIFAIRIITRLFKKVRIDCTGDRKDAAIASYKAIEEDLRALSRTIVRPDHTLDVLSGLLWKQVFPEILPEEIVCRHGPGATAEKKSARARFSITQWPERAEESFPLDLHAIPNYGWAEDLEKVRLLPLREEPPVRVVFVPKTLKAPRVIAIEPSHMMFMQQGVMRFITPILESHSLTKESLHFTDQEGHRELACRSSIDRKMATIDMKDASDRVHLHLVQRIFNGTSLLPLLEDSRSLHATLPDGVSILLSKFASMGSANCFPVEAMVFYTLIQSAVHQLHSVKPTSATVRRYSRQIRVYGDDIIIPVGWVDCVVDYLESYGLKVNRGKSFSRSHFRESCGGDYWNGKSVKPIYVREVIPESTTHWTPEAAMSLASTSDQLYREGLWASAQLVRDWIERQYGSVPRSRADKAGLSFYSVIFDTRAVWDQHLHNFRQKRIVFEPKKFKDPFLSGAAAILATVGQKYWEFREEFQYDNLGSLATCLVASRSELESSVKRGVFKQKRRWVTL